MKAFSEPSPAALLRRPMEVLPVAFLLGSLVLLTALYWLGQSIAMENYRKLTIGIVALQVVAIIIWWRASVYLFSAFVLIEGFLINYFSNNPELNLMKDTLVVTLFAALALRLVTKGIFPVPLTRWMLPFFAFAVIYLVQVFNPYLPNLLVGLAGVRTTLLYFLLVPIAFWFFNSRATVLHFFGIQLLLSVPVSLFGIVQYFRGPEWMLSLSPGFGRAIFYAYGERASAETTYFRTFSTFVQTGGFSQYLVAMMLLCVAAWLVPAFRRYRIWLAGIFVVQFLALLTTGGRGPFVMFFVASGLLLLLFRGAERTAPLLVLAPVILWVSVFTLGTGFLERFETLLDFDEVHGRTSALGYGWLSRAMNEDWAGLGAGYASIASRHVGTTPLNGIVVENTLAKVRFEAGLPGFLLFLVFVLVMMWEVLRIPGRVHDRDLRWFASCAGVYVFVILLTTIAGTPLDTSPSNTYLWLFAGFLARVQMISAAETPAATALPRVRSAS